MNKHLHLSIAILFLINLSPNAQESILEVDGAIQVGTTSEATPDEGTIKFDPINKVFQGWNGTSWVTFSGSGGGAIVKDIDNNHYTTVTIGSQTWLGENLRTTRYNDSTSIALVTDSMEWRLQTTPGYTWYENGADNVADYGALYNWYAVDTSSNGSKNICPSGWHVPSMTEGNALALSIGGNGGKLKESGIANWDAPNQGATNDTGFRALPGGYRSGDGKTFSAIGQNATYWSTTSNAMLPDGIPIVSVANLSFNSSAASSDFVPGNVGLAVRCIKD